MTILQAIGKISTHINTALGITIQCAVPTHTFISSSIDPDDALQCKTRCKQELQCGTAWTGHKLSPSPLKTSKMGPPDRQKGWTQGANDRPANRQHILGPQ